jgi:hypothetical protein
LFVREFICYKIPASGKLSGAFPFQFKKKSLDPNKETQSLCDGAAALPLDEPMKTTFREIAAGKTGAEVSRLFVTTL